MAPVLLVATVAADDANSYLAVADADALALADLGRHAAAWTKATADEKIRALIRATRDIDDYVIEVPSQWSYDPALGVPLQALLFPRGYDQLNGSPFIPAEVARATYEQAAYLLVNADAIDGGASRRAMGLSGFSNPDGTGGQIATDAHAGALAPRAERLLGRLTQSSVIATIVTT